MVNRVQNVTYLLVIIVLKPDGFYFFSLAKKSKQKMPPLWIKS